MFVRLLLLASPAVELAEPEVAVGDERAHPELVGERHGPTVRSLSFLHLQGIAMQGDLAEEAERPRLESSLLLRSRNIERTSGEFHRVIRSPGEQIRLAQHADPERMMEHYSHRAGRLQRLLEK